VGLSIIWRQFGRSLQQLLGFFKRVLLPADHSQVDFGGCKIGLQPKRLGEFQSRVFILRILNQHNSEFVVQIRPCRSQLDGAMEFVDRAGKILSEAQNSSDDSMGFGVIRREFHGCTSLIERSFCVLLRCECIGEIDMRLQKIWLELHRQLKLRDGLIQFAGCHEHPAQRVVSLWRIGREPHNPFESCPRGCEVPLLNRSEALLVEHVRRGLVGCLLRQPGQSERRQEKHDLGDSNSKGRYRNQENCSP
jgi:hypothetical protein